jgi:hypothetical protein
MYISARIDTASTGPVEGRFDYACQHCGARRIAAVRTVGVESATSLYGEGGGVERARAGAVHAASRNLAQAMSTVPCPDCGGLPPELGTLMTRVSAAHARADRWRRLRLPVAAATAGVTALLTVVPALLDLHNGRAGLVAALGTTAFVTALVVFVLSWPPMLPPLTRLGQVWLARLETPNEPVWVPAPALPYVQPIAPARLARTLSALIALVAFVEASAAVVVVVDSFVKVWVVDATGRGELTVEIDGKTAGRVRPRTDSKDVSFAAFTLRRGHEHQLVVVDPSGARETFSLDAASDGKRGWVVAPSAAKHDLCFVEIETTYRRPGSGAEREPDVSLLATTHSDVVPVMHVIDYPFEAPPGTMDLEKNQGEARKRSLRACTCSGFEAGQLVPFRARGTTARPPAP